MNCVLIGFGEIGRAVYETYSKHHNIDIVDPKHPSERALDNYDLMLVTMPYTMDFIEIVSKYQQDFKAKAKVIFSTLSIGTTAKLKDAVHVPIEGKHPNLAESVEKWQVFMGGFNQIVYDFFVMAHKTPYILEKSEHTEALKLMSTTNYGLMIEYARYCNEICKDIGMDYSNVNAYNGCYNNLYQELQMPQFSRYLLNPPEGAKGGHCVVPNSRILKEQYPSALIDVVAEVNQ
jgi:hypothetical protein